MKLNSHIFKQRFCRTQLDFSVAIDLTASNGQINKPGSLHYIGDGQPNEYFIAIRAVADICQHYNNTKNFDAMGFGAKIPPHYTAVNHCFPLVHFFKSEIENKVEK